MPNGTPQIINNLGVTLQVRLSAVASRYLSGELKQTVQSLTQPLIISVGYRYKVYWFLTV